MEACRKIFIEPNGINALINSMNSTNEMMVPENPSSVGVDIPQVYKRVKCRTSMVTRKY